MDKIKGKVSGKMSEKDKEDALKVGGEHLAKQMGAGSHSKKIGELFAKLLGKKKKKEQPPAEGAPAAADGTAPAAAPAPAPVSSH